MSAAVPGLYARVVVDIPSVEGFDYTLAPEQALRVRPGSLVVVPWGRARRIGLVLSMPQHTDIAADRLRQVLEVLDEAPVLDAAWLLLVEFAARYYHRSIGEVALPAIPKLLRTPPSAKARGSVFARARARWLKANPLAAPPPQPEATAAPDATGDRVATQGQTRALAALSGAVGFRVLLLHGVTGSGKTEVYLRWLAGMFARTPDAQALLLVPEIALTPQLFGQISRRFPGEAIAVLHSDLADGDRAGQWLAAADGRVRLVVGTRLAVLTPMPRLAAIVIDEEHDPSYRQQEGVRYSARDLAIALAAERRIPIVLGSATPSLESWRAARRGRYELLSMPERAQGGALPRLRIVDPRGQTMQHSLAPQTRQAVADTLARGKQVLVFVNRRGYAPVLTCEACGWLSRCDDCSAFKVLHRVDASPVAEPRSRRFRLVCHHCGSDGSVPRACPDCGNVDLSAMGRGTQRLEEGLRELYPDARVARVDRDVARRRGAAREVIEAAHAGNVDLLVGTQMLAKGHDFQRLSLVVVVDADAGLYSSDFRAPERLFALLMQVAGRAGRGGGASEFIVQTRFPTHPMFAALARHDYEGYANTLLAERRASALPPFVHQALLRAESKALDAALAFLAEAKSLAEEVGRPDEVTFYDPVPMPMMRVAGQERAQLLLESGSRVALQEFLGRWKPALDAYRTPVRWQLDIDPAEI